MSLQVDDRGRRTRSRSPGRRERSRSPAVPHIMEAREPSYAYPEDDLDERDRYALARRGDQAAPEPPGAFPGAPGVSSAGGIPYPEDESLFPGSRSMYGYDNRAPASPGYGRPVSPAAAGGPGSYYPDARNPRDRPEEPRIRTAEPRDSRDSRPIDDDKLKYLPQKYARPSSRAGPDDRDRDQRTSRAKSPRPSSPPSQYKYAEPPQYQYGQVDDKSQRGYEKRKDEDDLTYGADPYGRRDASPNPATRYSQAPPSPGPSRQKQYYGESRSDTSSNVLTVEPGGGDRRSGRRDRSPQPPHQRMSSLSVNNAHAPAAGMTLAAAPGSPLLESYRGTYQDMSPMPSPLLLASNAGPNVMEPLSPLGSDDERGTRRRRARFHDDPEDNATRLANALKGTKKDSAPDTNPLIEILPGLSHEQIMELRTEYKSIVKTGADRKGVNIAKHIRSRLKDADPSLMKACYAVALGRWESEAYWANFWYQGDKTRRELLIESLMGRSNDEIRLIKDSFSDKKYDNSLTKCMKTELKEDKFKKAVLMVLDERRMDDVDQYGRRLPVDFHLVDQDVDDLRRAVKSVKGGESLMIGIVVQRSDEHLREVLKTYERAYRTNFARDALKKSENLVGELLAHILNGVINKPVRDALLLNHALTASKRDGLRKDLLISRLVRYHWDHAHMEAIKRAYRERYRVDLQEAVREATSGEWGQFCYELCIYRMPNDVKRVERVQPIYPKDSIRLSNKKAKLTSPGYRTTPSTRPPQSPLLSAGEQSKIPLSLLPPVAGILPNLLLLPPSYPQHASSSAPQLDPSSSSDEEQQQQQQELEQAESELEVSESESTVTMPSWSSP
ncbi:hypothetical protein BN1708_000003 [Verticillium longisporum]|uniref:Annexin n=1 Tax=Verticillium longisporum TaxID=100787 RepID=A0A0G4KCD7_VERLO|nr:hypothetical protein BN1708_000003 [Verticillium longisporum]